LRSCILTIALLGGLTALPPLVAAATTATLLGTAEVRATTNAPLPQWRHVMRGIALEDEMVRACGLGPERCPNRAAMEWLALLRGLKHASRWWQVEEVNRFVNRAVYKADIDNYGQRDYWATPLEFFTRSGDCEDYAIAKYRSLRRLGVAADALRLVVVHDVIRDLPHAVLAVRVNSAVYILDNLSDAVIEQSLVQHYVPYYSVNEITRWAYLPGGGPAIGADRSMDVQPAQP
jgi:predicted transglutaminase-like cysteine proteinase